MEPQRRYIVGAIGVLLLASLAFGRAIGSKGQSRSDDVVFRVERGTLEIKVVEMGTLVAPRSVTIASEIQSNRAKVIRLMPEGTLVSEGELLVEFDATPFLEDISKFSRAVKEAEVNLLQAEQDAKLQAAKSEQALHDAEQRMKLAQLDVKTLEEGGEALSQKEARARVEQSQQLLLQMSQGFADAEAFLKDGFITRLEEEQARTRLADARRDYELAVANYQSLVEYRRPAELERSRVALERARAEVNQLHAAGADEEVKQQSLEVKARNTLESARSDLKRAEDELAKTKVVSPASGFLVFNEIPIGSEYRRVQVGDSVWNSQPIMTIPDTTQMAVDTSVREFDVHKIHSGQETRVTFEAFPDLALKGHVDFIGNLATKRGTTRGSKEFTLHVLLDESDAKLRPGMTAQVDISVRQIPDVLLLPIEAVFEKEGKPHCYAQEDGEAVEREIAVGESNSDRVVVLSGLDEGQLVSLTPRQRSSWFGGL